MCGIVGISLAQPAGWARGFVERMADSVRHRGPDSSGLYVNPQGTALLGFRRLAIRDLGHRADQPMTSASGETTAVFNGEIYNSRQLAAKYCSHVKLRTTGDTEVFLEGFESHGAAILPECNGMFGAVFCEARSGTLTLARDRMGKKPLYLFEGDGFVAIGSELRVFRELGLEPDPSIAPYFFHFGYVPSPFTFFQRVSQVCPGEIVAIRHGRIVSRRRFHDFTDCDWGSEPHLDLGKLHSELADAVALRTLSDVPVGAFLSGGVDSALVAAYLKATGQSIPTYTVAFRDTRFNEAPFAREVAKYLGLPHVEIPIDESRLPEMVGDFLDCYEQPYADWSGLPSMLLCREVKQHVTVALSGDGGDEFFGGYARYDWFRTALQAQRLPSLLRSALRTLTPRVDPRRGRRMQRLLETADAAGIYAALIRGWHAGSLSELLPDQTDADEKPVQLVRDVFDRLHCDDLAKAACFDAAYYIPDDLQVKMDRASMHVSLEVRCPLLDPRVAARGAALTTRAKFWNGKKTALRKLLARHVPPRLFERPKQGFSVPMAQWLRGPLREPLHDALRQQSFRECGWLNFAAVDRLLEDFRRGHAELAAPLWTVFVLAQVLSRCESSARFNSQTGTAAARRVA